MLKSLITTLILFSFLIWNPYRGFASAVINLDLGSVAASAVVTGEESQLPGPEKVEVAGQQKGQLLALVPLELPVKVTAYADGRVRVSYPWYAFMTLTGKAELETRLKSAVNNARQRLLVGSVRAEGEPDQPRFTPAEVEAVSESVRGVLAEFPRN